MRSDRLALALLSLLLGGLLAPALGTRAATVAQAEICFAETNKCVRGRFLEYWLTNGGLARNGYPLSEERRELLEDGQEYTVQYFERVRMEYHPENPPPYDVLLGQFGRRIYFERETTSLERAVPMPGQVYFAETGHNLGGRFLDYWQANGGLAQFGFPITEEFRRQLGGPDSPEGGPYIVVTIQYFERARFEYHTQNAPPYDVLLGQFGRQILAENDLLIGSFRYLYITNEAVRTQLGMPVGREMQVPGATQEFEHGRMVYLERGGRLLGQAEGKAIYVLCGDQHMGTWLPFPDTWEEGQPEGGGPAPVPDLFFPKRGFGKVWRDNPEVQRCLGYARTADEQALPLVVQSFRRVASQGKMLSSATPEGRFIFVLTYYASKCGGRVCRDTGYTRYADRSR